MHRVKQLSALHACAFTASTVHEQRLLHLLTFTACIAACIDKRMLCH